MKKNELAFKLVPVVLQFQFEVGTRDDGITKSLLKIDFVVCLIVARMVKFRFWDKFC